MTHPPLRLAVFDVDGTLVDSQHNIVAAMAEAWRMHGLGEVRPEAVRRVIGLSLVEAVARLLPDGDPDHHERIAEGYKQAFFALRQRPDHDEPLFAGTLDALAALDEAGWLLAMATGKSRRGALAVVERHSLHGRFVSIQTADDNPGKPHPAMLLRALEECGVAPTSAVMIGDTTYDMEMAGAARVAGLGVSWGCHAVAELRQAGAHAVIDDLIGLPSLLADILKERACVSEPC